MQSFENLFAERKKLIDAVLAEPFRNKNKSYKTIIDAMEYSVKNGGKRIRPVIMLGSYELFKRDYESILPFAAAIEYIHTYSLIHDDLPCMDNDDLRRGMPTNHIKFGEGMATLAGDGLLNLAFETALTCENENTLKALRVLARFAGTDGMIGGQVIDIESEGREISESLLDELVILKTGALLRASASVGAILGGADDKETESLDTYGKYLGLAFQIRDDILDVTSTEQLLGKPVLSDEKNNKNTFVTMYGLEKCEKMVREYTDAAKSAVSRFGEKSLFLHNLADYLINRNK